MTRLVAGLWLVALACLQLFAAATIGDTQTISERVIPAQFGEVITANISSSKDALFRLKYELTNLSSVVRLWVQSVAASADDPLLVVVRQPRSIISWQVPLPLENKYYYNVVGRTLCPLDIGDLAVGGGKQSPQPETVYVEFSTPSVNPLPFNATASLITNFLLKLDERRSVNISSSQPQYFGFIVPDEADSVVLHVRSNDKKCLIVSVQEAKCPVFDLDTNVLTVGTYQTMTTRSAISLQRNIYPQFFVVFVVKPDDLPCTGIATIIPPGPNSDQARTKTVQVWIEKAASYRDYVIAISITLASFVLIYLVTFLLWALYSYRDDRDPCLVEARRRILQSITNDEIEPLISPPARDSSTISYGAINRRPGSGSSGEQPSTSGQVSSSHPREDASGPDSIDHLANAEDGLDTSRQRSVIAGYSDEYDILADAADADDKSFIRIKTNLVVADLARKPFKKLNRKYSMYHWNLITIAIFYTLPVVQLVITYQTVVSVTGNEDICYYNFECARPLGPVFAFNTVFSNIGYVLFGLLFLMMVRIRDVKHQIRMKENEVLESKYGIPSHYGLFYSMGIALVMEGVLSASYHICPNYTNFQFDTAFMYMIAALCMLKIYQIRHPDINAHSHVAYAVMAIIILIAVVGVIYNSVALWIVFSLGFMLLVFMISAEFYYKSQWKIDRGVFRRVRQEWRSGRGFNKLRPTYPDRMIYLVLCNGMNLAFVIWGLIERPKAFAAFLVVVFISNLMLYLVFYIAMKLRHRERLKGRAIVIGLFAAATWAGSFFFFLHERISWMKSPSRSRELNDGCVLFAFYDTHDIWHFLSSLALFLSFLLTMVMDDDLKYTPQDKIAVF